MALAAPASVQDALYPDFVAKGDELVQAYSNALSAINIKQELDEKQQDVLGVLEDYLTVNAGEEFATMYCDTSALYTDSRWEEIRGLAKAFIKVMDWTYSAPEKNQATYLNAEFSQKNTS